MEFTYSMPTRVVFGGGTSGKIGEEVERLGAAKVLIVTGRKSMKDAGILDKALDSLRGCEVAVFDGVESDPTTETVDECVNALSGCDAIVGLGGGSALDAAKAVSVVASNGGHAADYLNGRVAGKPGVPIVAVPTTAGTASEVTEVSVLSDVGRGIKKSFRSRHMYPAVALDDYELTFSMPKEVTASSGLDALTHAIESMSSKSAQPVPSAVCLEAARLALENLGRAYEDGSDWKAREAMMLSSLMAGFGITHSGAGLCHGLSYAIWRVAKKPHGSTCGMLLPHVMEYNLGHDRGTYDAIARHAGMKSPDELISAVRGLNASMGIPERLSAWGISSEDIPEMVEYGLGGSTRNNPRQVSGKGLSDFIGGII